jgi:hypothetical protein
LHSTSTSVGVVASGPIHLPLHRMSISIGTSGSGALAAMEKGLR